MKKRIILHIDINHCYAQMEEVRTPELRHVPLCVGGDEKTRSGIVLARNLIAKDYKVKTAETLRDAFRKCKDLVVLQPDFDYYLYLANQVKEIYNDYTDQVESFGVDEAWLDLTHTCHLFGKPMEVAKMIQDRIYDEFGLTVSIGVSDNKIFAKLGSDYMKPSGLTLIDSTNYKEVAWPLPCQDLLYVGPNTQLKLNYHNIHTIGDIAQTPIETLEKLLGKAGHTIWYFANGLDDSKITNIIPTAKSISNGITTPTDMITFTDAKLVFFVLVESICTRMKKASLITDTINIKLRDTNLKTISRQKKLSYPTNLVQDIIPVVLELLFENYDFSIPLRSVSVAGMNLNKGEVQVQTSLNFDEDKSSIPVDDLMDDIHLKYGHDAIKRANKLLREDLTDFNPVKDHIIYPGGNS